MPRTTHAFRAALTGSLFVAVPALLALVSPRAHADDGAQEKIEANQRCAVRLSIALTGKSASASLLASADPQGAVDAMLASPEFADRFARFINAEFNGGPSASAADDAVYWLASHVVSQKKPWTDLFVGPYQVAASSPTATSMTVTADPNGLGYFRTQAWMKRYAGNEPSGYMLSASFRILSNTTGLTLIPSVGSPGDDRTTTGRQAPACKGCHFDPWFALDRFARLLPMRKGAGDTMTFTPPTEGPQTLLGKTIANDKDLVQSLVASDAWRVNQCRNVYKFLYGRIENQCEAPVFDRCVDALVSPGTIQAAVAAVAKDATFCGAN